MRKSMKQERRSAYSRRGSMAVHGLLQDKPLPEGNRNKCIQAIVSPPLKEKKPSDERNEFLEAITAYLREPTAETDTVLMKAAKKMMIRSAEKDAKATDIVARSGKDRDILNYLLDRMEELEPADFTSTSKWRRVRLRLIKNVDSLRSSYEEANSSTSGWTKGKNSSTKTSFDSSVLQGKHAASRTSSASSGATKGKPFTGDRISMDSSVPEENIGEDREGSKSSIDSRRDENNAHTRASRSWQNEANNNTADANNARSEDSSSDSSGKEITEKTDRDPGLDSSSKENTEETHRESFGYKGQTPFRDSSEIDEDNIPTEFKRKSIIRKSGRGAKFFLDSKNPSDQELCVIWDDEVSVEGTDSLSLLAHDLRKVFDSEDMDWDSETSEEDSSDEPTDDESDKDESIDDKSDEEVLEAEDMFKSEFRSRYEYILPDVELICRQNSEIAFTRAYSDEDGEKLRRVNYDEEEKIMSELILDQNKKKFTSIEYDKEGNKLVAVQFDKDGIQVNQTYYNGKKKLESADATIKQRLSFKDEVQKYFMGKNRRKVRHLEDKSTPPRRTEDKMTPTRRTGDKMTPPRLTESKLTPTRRENAEYIVTSAGSQGSVIEEWVDPQVEYQKWLIREDTIALQGSKEDLTPRPSFARMTSKKPKGTKKLKSPRGASSQSDERNEFLFPSKAPAEVKKSRKSLNKLKQSDQLYSSSQQVSPKLLSNTKEKVGREKYAVPEKSTNSPSHSGEDLASLTQKSEKVPINFKPADKAEINQYLCSHGIYDLLQFMMSNLIHSQPDKPIDYLIDMARTINKNLKIRRPVAVRVP